MSIEFSNVKQRSCEPRKRRRVFGGSIGLKGGSMVYFDRGGYFRIVERDFLANLGNDHVNF